MSIIGQPLNHNAFLVLNLIMLICVDYTYMGVTYYQVFAFQHSYNFWYPLISNPSVLFHWHSLGTITKPEKHYLHMI